MYLNISTIRLIGGKHNQSRALVPQWEGSDLGHHHLRDSHQHPAYSYSIC